MEIDLTTFRLADFIVIAMIIGGYFVQRHDLKRVIKFTFRDDGTPKVVTYESLDRIRDDCLTHRNEKESSMQDQITKVDDRSIKVGKCVAVLEHQIEGGC